MQLAVNVTDVFRGTGLGTDALTVQAAAWTTMVTVAGGVLLPPEFDATKVYVWLPTAGGVTLSVGEELLLTLPSGAVNAYVLTAPPPGQRPVNTVELPSVIGCGAALTVQPDGGCGSTLTATAANGAAPPALLART